MFTNFQAEKSLRTMATDMQDTKILSRILFCDLVANEAKYHLGCWTKYRNKHRAFQTQNDPVALSRRCDTAKVQMTKVRALTKARPFVELVEYMENTAEDRTFLFKLTQIHSCPSQPRFLAIFRNMAIFCAIFGIFAIFNVFCAILCNF